MRYQRTGETKQYNFPYVKYRNGTPVTFFKNKVVYAEQHEKVLKQLETEQLRLAACGVVAISDTPESAAKARDIAPEYFSGSMSDVIRRVDECISLRSELARVKAERDAQLECVRIANRSADDQMLQKREALADLAAARKALAESFEIIDEKVGEPYVCYLITHHSAAIEAARKAQQ